MSDEQKEPGELTERFQAFAQSVDPQPGRGLPLALIGLAAVVLIALIVAIVVLMSG